MINKVKDIDVKNRTHYFFNDIINMKNFDPNNIKIDEKSYKNILFYYIGYVTIQDSKYVKINSVHPLYFIFNKVNGYFEETIKYKKLSLLYITVSFLWILWAWSHNFYKWVSTKFRCYFVKIYYIKN